ncbi:MAG: pitrilysin family protein [Bacilli bacterium]|nr:pitrilysin family protein [Bacilli bacterium]MDD4719091.1 pitrilysin family protein [Bacilli bacterium]
MKPIPLNKLDLDLYQEKLDNGLEVYIIPKENVNNVYITFSTRFGSKHYEFVPINKDKTIKVPPGVAHFLEHKLFEQKNGVEPFTFFVERGADANANTSNHKTTYLISAQTNIEENLEFLLDFVQEPYFTDANVKKEKGIIEQEIKMYQDYPFMVLYEKSLENTIAKHPIRIPIIGIIESINKITKEDLYTCYDTFYHPSNMFLVITGNVKPELIMEVIKKNQIKKQFPEKINQIKIKKYNEPDKVVKEKEEISMNVALSKISNNYKFNISNIKDIPRRDIIDYILLYFEIKIGNTSVFNDTLKQEGIINNDLEYTLVDLDTHIIIMVIADTEQPQKLIETIRKEINNFDIKEEDFERKKKNIISSYIYMSDNIYRINNKIMANIINEGKVLTDDYNEVKKFNFETLKKFIENTSFENNNYVIINPNS